jgi:hypothetical protein
VNLAQPESVNYYLRASKFSANASPKSEPKASEGLEINRKGNLKMKTSILKIVFAVAAAGVAFGIFAPDIYAQPRAARGRVYTKAEVEQIIKRVEDRSDKFKKEFDKALDRSRLNNSNREDRLNQYAKDLEKNTDELRREFDRRDSWIDNKDEVRKCLSAATRINVAMRNRRLGPKVESTWSALRFELNTLAQVYNLPPVGSAGY